MASLVRWNIAMLEFQRRSSPCCLFPAVQALAGPVVVGGLGLAISSFNVHARSSEETLGININTGHCIIGLWTGLLSLTADLLPLSSTPLQTPVPGSNLVSLKPSATSNAHAH